MRVHFSGKPENEFHLKCYYNSHTPSTNINRDTAFFFSADFKNPDLTQINLFSFSVELPLPSSLHFAVTSNSLHMF